MPTLSPVAFCPAAASALAVAEAEANLHRAWRLRIAVDPVASGPLAALQTDCERLFETLALEVERARDRLAEAEPVSPIGAMTQLLGAIRDLRVGDDNERIRARKLEGRATEFLRRSRLIELENAQAEC